MAVTLPFRRLDPFGVEVDFDLAQPLAPSLAYHFRELWRQHCLLLARGQDLTVPRQSELCALLGPVLPCGDHPVGAMSLHASRADCAGLTTRFRNTEATAYTVLEHEWRQGDVIFWNGIIPQGGDHHEIGDAGLQTVCIGSEAAPQ